VQDRESATPDAPLDGPVTTRPAWRRPALAAGAVILGLAVVVGFAVANSGTNDGDAASGQTWPGTPATESERPSSTLVPTASAPAVSPTSSPPTSTSASFSLLPPAQPPADFEGQLTCQGSIGPSDPVAVVRLVASDPAVAPPEVLRDYADISQPRTACTFGYARSRQLVDAHHLVVGDDGTGTYAVIDLPELRFHWFHLVPYSAEAASSLLAVSPRLDQVAWLKWRPGQYDTLREIHVTTAAGDTVVASLPDEPTGFCGAPFDYARRGAYSPSGTYLSVLDLPRSLDGDGGLQYSLRVFEGTRTVLSFVPSSDGWPPGGHPAMAVWSPTSDTLYYRQGTDVWRWNPSSGSSVFLPGVSWSLPTISPDGRHMAYLSEGDAYLAELAGATNPQLIGAGATRPPRFLNNDQLWLYATAADHGCVGSEGSASIYNVTDGSLSPTIIDTVLQAWPATSASW
jgi:hypothetical protein